MKPHIAIIGSCVCDVVVEVPHLPQTAQDVNVIKQSLSLGGCAYNVANILERFNVPYLLFSPIGQGIYGDFVRKELHKEQMSSLLENVNGENGCCYCMVENNGERTFISYHGVEYQFQKDWFTLLDQYPIDTVYVCGLEIEEDTGIHIIHYLKQHPDLKIYFAPGPRICEIDQTKMEALFQLSCILHINEEEALHYSHKDNIDDAAHYLYSLTHAPLIITLGEKGSYCFDGNQDYFVETKKVIPVDTIGAGDSHIGTIIATQFLRHDWVRSLEIANHISSAVVLKNGAGIDITTFQDTLKKIF